VSRQIGVARDAMPEAGSCEFAVDERIRTLAQGLGFVIGRDPSDGQLVRTTLALS
jgi:hypothetical protein